ncbi:DMT family transporter [Rhizobiaceae bacterium BDR2-2]|uniref:DMT family transporter n=1 Tax=Ectorhizobium quercum TaxID=2965071 RepID=A0AAE3MZ69_9HYPH|nr:DMT family transporter [Ectorhizobium quercum]MCX8997983.1 DMT family transporter [Ectorhizobium quercum]
MISAAVLAFSAGLLISLSRQINGRLSLSTSPLAASFWNHVVGLAALTAVGLVIGGIFPPGAEGSPWWAYFGGPLGVIFVASGSWLIVRIGATNTALLVIGGQMVTGIALDLLMDQKPVLWASALGVVLIVWGVWLSQKRG